VKQLKSTRPERRGATKPVILSSVTTDRCHEFLKTFSPKNLATIFGFFTRASATFGKNLIATLVLEKNYAVLKRIILIVREPQLGNWLLKILA
jgi:hypothetical protein